MPFVKLDCGLLDSSLWPVRDSRDIFITALLMAEPVELRKETETIQIDSLEPDSFKIPAGWYGLVRAANVGIISRCGLPHDAGMSALKILASPDPDSRSKKFEGRRIARIDGGFIILNFDVYRQRDYSNAERQARWRDRHRRNGVTITDVTQAEAEAEAEEIKNTEVAPLPVPSLTRKPPFKVSSPMVNAWCRAYQEFFKEEYLVKKGDENAAKEILTLKNITVESIIEIARKAWSLKDDPAHKFNCKNSVTLRGLVSRFTEIKNDIGELRAVKTAWMPPKMSAEECNEREKQRYLKESEERRKSQQVLV